MCTRENLRLSCPERRGPFVYLLFVFAADPLQTLGKSSTSLCFGFVVFKVDGAYVF